MRYLLLIVLGFLAACGKDEPESGPTIAEEPTLLGTWQTPSRKNSNCGTIHWFSEIEFRVTAICLLAPTDAYVMITEGTYIVVDNVIDFRIDKATCDPNPPDYLLRIDELKADTMKTTLEGIPQMTWERLESLDTREFKIDANITYGCILTDGTFTESPLD